MFDYIDDFWKKRISQCAEALKENNFDTYLAADSKHAGKLFSETIFPELEAASVSWADSESLKKTGILEYLRSVDAVDFIDTFEPGISREQSMERRRQALLVDLFLTGSNAVTESGWLVNLDMVGNRVGGITFGPRYVVLVIGRNKIVKDLDAAMARIKGYAAPMNAIRHEGWKTPCIKTSFCMDCSSPQRICNTWSITQKSYPKSRIKVILVNEDLGL